ncbi:MAG: S8 family serine peptidase [Luteolibacter sp.]|uniref:S8 family serine peptidase n=1 Tax=Luteolibacter sp. TaxID=1962973 RepID=UPI0032659CDF
MGNLESLHADWRDDIGFTRLKQVALSDSLPAFPNDGLTQVEASLSETPTLCIPDTASPVFSGKTFVPKTGAVGVSFHATHVATNFYGSTSQIPGACGVDLYLADNWLFSDFLKMGSNTVPAVESRAVQNHSWVGSLEPSFSDAEANRRLDYAINRDGFVCVVGSDNNGSTTLPGLLSQSYNTISVGRDDGGHSAGLTAIDGTGRMKPDIVAPSADPEYATSWTTPMVAGSAGLLYQKLTNSYAISGADLPRVIKALLLASATKNTVPGWDNTATSPLDSVYGAGELNIYHAYSTLRSGKATASNSIQYNIRGWAAETVSSNSTKTYYFNIPAGPVTTPFSAALTWHRISTKSGANNWDSTLPDLGLHLHHATGFTVGSEIAASNSAVDNVELVYQSALAPGNYALVVQSAATSTATPYALAWHSLPTVTIAATAATAREIDGQTGLVTISRTGDTTLPLLVPLTVSGTAVAGAHYQPIPATVTIPTGQASTTLTITPISDALAQGDRNVILNVAADFALVRDPAQSAVVTIQDKPFDAWRFANFTAPELTQPAISAENSDPDGDRLANLIEYALGLPPKIAGTSPIIQSNTGGYLTLSATKNTAATDVIWNSEVTDNLSIWQSAVIQTNTTTAFQARDSVLSATAGKRFIRLKITRP